MAIRYAPRYTDWLVPGDFVAIPMLTEIRAKERLHVAPQPNSFSKSRDRLAATPSPVTSPRKSLSTCGRRPALIDRRLLHPVPSPTPCLVMCAQILRLFYLGSTLNDP